MTASAPRPTDVPDAPGAPDAKSTPSQELRMVGLEEHAWTVELKHALVKDGTDDTVRMIADGFPDADEQLLDVGDRRLERMDASGIDVAVLSTSAPGTQPLKPSEAVPLARDANDYLAGAVRAHPDRYAAFATLPISDPDAAVQEFERCITQLGMVGAMLFPRTGERYLDHDTFRAIFEVAATHDVPIYIHPQFPPQAIRDIHFSGFGDKVDTLLAAGGWGWHAEVGIVALRLMLAGTFDRHPNLQIMLGHWGEMLVPFVERANVLSTLAGLDRSIAECVTGNVLVTAGGIYSQRMLKDAIATVGIDRVLFAADDPFGGEAQIPLTHAFLRDAPLSAQDKVKIASGNAQRHVLKTAAHDPAGSRLLHQDLKPSHYN